MKKISLLGLGMLTATCAMAQQPLVKDVERELKSAPESYPAAIEKLKPAFTDEGSATDAYTWFVAGKGAVDFFDNQQVLIQMGNDKVDKKAVGHALVDGLGFFEKALPLDSVADAKGKIKTKYSKKILDLAQNHYLDLQNAAVYMYQSEDFPGAYEAWRLFAEGKENPMLAPKAKQYADTVFGEIYFNMGLASALNKDHQKSLDAFKKAIQLGYEKKNAYDFAISEASELQNTGEMAEIARMAYPIYGKEDSRYIGFMVNDLIAKKDFANANKMLDEYIAAEPDNSELYYVKGILCDSEGNTEGAIAAFRRAIELNAENARALLQLGYQLCKQGDAIDESEGGGLSNAEYNKLRAEKVDPLYREAAGYLEQAYKLNEELDDARTLLRGIYYKLNDEENLKRVEAM